MRRRHDGLRRDRQDVGVPPAAEYAAGGVVEDEVVADVDPGDRCNAFGNLPAFYRKFVKFKNKFRENPSKLLSSLNPGFMCVKKGSTMGKVDPDMRSEKVMVRLAP